MGDDDDEVIDWPSYAPTSETLDGCYELAGRLFQDIKERFGEKEARRIFSSCRRPDEMPHHERKKREVLNLYSSMKPLRNKLALAKELADKNNTLPHKDRFAKGSTSINTMFKYIDRAVKEEKRKYPNLYLLLEQLAGNTRPKRRAKRRTRRR